MSEKNGYTADEMMTIAAARMIRNGATCFVGIGLPSAAANLARLTHAPETVLIYESGTIGTKPPVLPLSIGDGELFETAEATVSIPEIFAYWLQGGRIDLGFLGAAQIDRFANINTTVIGDYHKPSTRLPGAGGAPEIAASSKEVLITLRHNKRAFVEKLDFVTSGGHMEGGDSREKMRLPGKGPTAVITDLGILTPDPKTKELTLTSLHPGIPVEKAVEATGWKLKVAPQVATTAAPTETELAVLRDLHARTARAHAGNG
jgi:glutaconate CoA-transferase subunit B